MTCVVLCTECASEKWHHFCKLALLYRCEALAKALAEQPLAAAATVQLAATANAELSSLVQLALQQWDEQGRGLPSLLDVGSPARSACGSPHASSQYDGGAAGSAAAVPLASASGAAGGMSSELGMVGANAGVNLEGDSTSSPENCAGATPVTTVRQQAPVDALRDYLWATAAAGTCATPSASSGSGGGGSAPPSPGAFFHSAGSSAASPASSRRSSFAAEAADVDGAGDVGPGRRWTQRQRAGGLLSEGGGAVNGNSQQAAGRESGGGGLGLQTSEQRLRRRLSRLSALHLEEEAAEQEVTPERAAELLEVGRGGDGVGRPSPARQRPLAGGAVPDVSGTCTSASGQQGGGADIALLAEESGTRLHQQQGAGTGTTTVPQQREQQPQPQPPAPPGQQPGQQPGVQAPAMGLFDVLRTLPPQTVWVHLLRRLGTHEWSALRLLSREWDAQIRGEWCDTLQLVLGPRCLAELRRRQEAGPQHSLAARFAAARGLLLHHRRIERLVMPNTSTYGSSGLLEMPPVVVDDAPPLAEALQLAVAPLGQRLRKLHVTSEPGPVSDLDLDLLTVMAPELEELVVRFDVHETPAPELQGLSQLRGLRRLGLQLSSSKLNYDPAPERLVRSLRGLTALRALSLDLTAAELPLPGRELAGLTSLRLAVVWRGYSAASQGGGQSEQLRGLVSSLAQLTALRALAVPDGYRGADGDLLRAAAPVLPSLTALHLPRLSATRPELQALERLPLLQHVTLGSVDVAPDEDYEGLDLSVPYGGYGASSYSRYGGSGGGYGGGGRGMGASTGAASSMPSQSSLSFTALDQDNSGQVMGGFGGATSAPSGPVTFLRPAPLDPWASNGCAAVADGDPWAAGPCGAAASPRSRPLEGSLPPTPGSAGGGGGWDGGGGVPGAGEDGGEVEADGRPGVLRGMASWRSLVLCGEQRMEALVAAGPLPRQLTELRVEQLRWPRGSRADALTGRGLATLRALCRDLSRLRPTACVHLGLECLPGAATAPYDPQPPPGWQPPPGNSAGSVPGAAAQTGAAAVGGGAGVAAAGSRGRAGAAGSTTAEVAFGLTGVQAVVDAACEALGRVRGLESLRWGGLAALLAHLHPAAMERALARLRHVRDLELAGCLSGAPPAASPTLLLQLAGALAALPALRRLRLSAAAPNTDALVQGLPGLLVALRQPLRLEAAFLSHDDAAQLRRLLGRVAAAGTPAAAGQEQRSRGQEQQHQQQQGVQKQGAERRAPQFDVEHAHDEEDERRGACPALVGEADGMVAGCGAQGGRCSQGQRGSGGEGATVVVWEAEACMSSGGAAGGPGAGGSLTALAGREMQNCHGGWAAGGGLWWAGEEDEGCESGNGW